MQTLELPLYSTVESRHKIDNSYPEEITSKALPKPALNPHASIEQVLNAIVPKQTEKNRINRTRKHLGEIATTLSDEQIDCITTEFQFLIDTWLDEYEKEVFDGKTLKEVLHEG